MPPTVALYSATLLADPVVALGAAGAAEAVAGEPADETAIAIAGQTTNAISAASRSLRMLSPFVSVHSHVQQAAT